jgi:hypothetical protein
MAVGTAPFAAASQREDSLAHKDQSSGRDQNQVSGCVD